MVPRYYVYINTRIEALDAIGKLKNDDRLGVDCEGIDLSRKGELCVLQISVRGGGIYIFDVTMLGDWLFDAGLRDVLEDKAVLKFMFDCRNDADALKHNHGVDLKGIMDLQLLEVMTRGSRHNDASQHLLGLAKAMLLHLQRDVETTKLLGAEKFLADMHIWKRRPIDKNLLDYCANDVQYFFPLFYALLGQVRAEYRPLFLKRLETASELYASSKRDLPYRTYDRYENNSLLPLRIIPDICDGVLQAFPQTDSHCQGCRRCFSAVEMVYSKCRACYALDEKECRKRSAVRALALY